MAPGPPAGGYGANGSLAQGAAVYGPFDVFVDSHDNVFYADLGNNFPDGGAPNTDHTIPFNNNVIREVPATAQTVPFAMAAGAVYTVAGVPGVAGVGFTTSTTGNPVVATAALLQQPRGISVDTAGNLFFADNGNQVIREVPCTGGSLTAGNIYVVAGVAGSRGFAGRRRDLPMRLRLIFRREHLWIRPAIYSLRIRPMIECVKLFRPEVQSIPRNDHDLRGQWFHVFRG